MNTFHCTHYIEEGCLTLRQRAEYKSDKDLYHVIRLQRIIDRIDTLANPAYSDHEAQAAYLRTLAELDEFRSQLVSDACDSRESLSPAPSAVLLSAIIRLPLYAVSYCQAFPLSSSIF